MDGSIRKITIESNAAFVASTTDALPQRSRINENMTAGAKRASSSRPGFSKESLPLKVLIKLITDADSNILQNAAYYRPQFFLCCHSRHYL